MHSGWPHPFPSVMLTHCPPGSLGSSHTDHCLTSPAEVQAVPSVYRALPHPSSLHSLLLNLLQSLLKHYIFSEAFSDLFISNYTPPTTPYTPSFFNFSSVVTTTLYHILEFIYFVYCLSLSLEI